MTQADRVLDALRDGPLCSMEPLEWEPRITRTAAVVHLLKGRGHWIVSANCVRHGKSQEGRYHSRYTFLGPVLEVEV